ncbi:hypothetical protein FHS51_001385 [Sphingobium wenxiniae]|uniref:Uncharacterized protein n=1 Tax=Sphingobium wenxiniae (strain DSM 21828 / CGMCC 1.7748 / JZ-1) TaxID=595605 RepID=A0A562KKY4_SPHWJ|nr:hypothetical protein [Sphingobium wenxiniae]MBB6191163.1 hypothetical protein [Sphingobium wenxiniae]TWH96037.1 hypothetical protein IQ35_01126 [Sphingobium wenxiniae]
MTAAMNERQEILDRFYWQHGPCCAGCDHWRHINALFGECVKSQPGLSGADRAAMLGMTSISAQISAGRAVTKRDEHCGAFADAFAWRALPLPYLKRIGAPLR